MGRRVSIRRVVERASDGRPLLGDVVGDLLGLDAQTAVVETRGGPVEVPVAGVTVARLVPPATADELALDAVAAAGWRPAERAEVGGWVLRADPGGTRRANSVLPLRPPGRPLDEALTAATDWYAERGRPLLLQVPVEARRLLDAELGERGWPAEGRTRVYAARLDALTLPADAGHSVELATAPDGGWAEHYRGGSTGATRELLTRHDSVVFAAVREAGAVLGIGRGVVDSGWLGVSALEVDPAHRRRGVATAVLAALRDWGTDHGAVRGYLQVEVDNEAAIPLYERAGYWAHHEYHYRTPPAT